MQYFSKSFSKTYLNKYLDHGRNVEVFNKHCDTLQVWMKIDKGKGKRTVITSGWKDVVKAIEMKKDHIFLFWFRRATEGGIKLIIKKVWQ
jgi:hypothetical protein